MKNIVIIFSFLSLSSLAYADCQVQQAVDSNGQPTTLDVCDNGTAFGSGPTSYSQSGGGNMYVGSDGSTVMALPAPRPQAAAPSPSTSTDGGYSTSSVDYNGSAKPSTGAKFPRARFQQPAQDPSACHASQRADGSFALHCD